MSIKRRRFRIRFGSAARGHAACGSPNGAGGPAKLANTAIDGAGETTPRFFGPEQFAALRKLGSLFMPAWTAKAFTPVKEDAAMVVKLDVPIVDDRQSAHVKITGTLKDAGYRVENGDLVFERVLYGLRNTILLPAGWEAAAASQSGTIGTYRGRVFIAFVNLNAENHYKVTSHARKAAQAR